jgi:hypothetical protein
MMDEVWPENLNRSAGLVRPGSPSATNRGKFPSLKTTRILGTAQLLETRIAVNKISVADKWLGWRWCPRHRELSLEIFYRRDHEVLSKDSSTFFVSFADKIHLDRRFSSLKKLAGSMTMAGSLLQRAFYAGTGIRIALGGWIEFGAKNERRCCARIPRFP